MSAAPPPTLEVRDLRTYLFLRRGVVRAVDAVNLTVARGESLAVVGESGSGKSMLCHSLVRLEPRPAARIVSGEIRLEGEDLARRSLATMHEVRGRRLGMILQDPLGALNPVLSIGDQLREALRLSHPRASRAELDEQAAAALEHVGIPEPVARLRAYPFEFSGGMRQRVCAAIAVARRPALLIADEPTTALDVTTQAQFLNLLGRLRAEAGMSLVLVTHDLGIVSRASDRVAVMYAGRVVETARTRALIRAPRHPYTRALLAALPHLDGPRLRRMAPIHGEPAAWATALPGCRFAPRCAHAMGKCRTEYPPTVRYTDGDEVACWLHADGGLAFAPVHGQGELDAAPSRSPSANDPAAPLLELQDVSHVYGTRRGARPAPAVDGVSLSLRAGDSLGVAGESGSGKTTLARMILQLVAPTAGRIVFDGREVDPGDRSSLKRFRTAVQAVFQDSSAALNGRMRIRDLIAEPLVIQRGSLRAGDVDNRVRGLMGRVGLPPESLYCFPHELSGGQKQRVAIARSLIVDPRLLILDEPVSALDVSVRSQVLNLLLDLREERGLTYLMIGHDLAVLRHVTDAIAVMYRGRIVEHGPTEAVLAQPSHPYTRALIAASPRLDDARAALGERADTAAAAPAGCAFAPRCPDALSLCWKSSPQKVRVSSPDASPHVAACHRASGVARTNGIGPEEKT